MGVWTISWQAGSGGERAARLLAERAGVPLVDSEMVHAAVRSELERQGRTPFPPWVIELALSVAPMLGVAPEPVHERSVSPNAREMAASVILEAARSPCVVADHAAFAILADHPGTCHVRIRAPLAWRIQTYARENCLSREAAKHAVAAADRHGRLYVERTYRRMLASEANFTVVCDASRLQLDDLVSVMLVAGSRPTSTTRTTVDQVVSARP
jgi:hypothetical protein